MIIKITCKDNDFTHLLEDFLGNIWSNWTCDYMTTINKYEHWVKNKNEYMDYLLASFKNITDKTERAKAVKESKSIDDIEKEMYKLASQCFSLENKINKMVNPNLDYELSQNDKLFIIDRIKKSFNSWIKPKVADYTATYIMSNLEVKIIKSFTDKWENGEVVYWMQHSNKILTQ